MTDKKIVPKLKEKDLAKKPEDSLAVTQAIDINASAANKKQETDGEEESQESEVVKDQESLKETQVDPVLPKTEKDEEIKNEEIEEETIKDELISVETNDKQEEAIGGEDISTVSANLVSDSASSPGFLAKNKKTILVILVLLIAAGAAGGGFYFYKAKKNTSSSLPETEVAEPIVSPAIELEAESSPTPIPLERKDLNIQVLNGSGTAGKAGQVKNFLENLGYEDVDTGNAESYDYEETEIAIKANKKDYLEILIGDLSEDYALAQDTKTLAEESEFDAVVTVGKK